MTKTKVQHSEPADSTSATAGVAPDGATRRTVLVGAAGLAGAGVLAACGGSTSSESDSSGGEADEGVDGLVSVADVPVGGGVVVASAGVVVTQPADGEIKGFSSTCTHQGCQVGSVEGGTINCPCHGSRFSVENGAVEQGPATQPLPEVEVEVSDGVVRLV